MLHIEAKKSNDLKKPAQTLVVFAVQSGQNIETLAPVKEAAGIVDKAVEHGLTFDQIKKGVFLRSLGPAPYRHLLVIGTDMKNKNLEKVRELSASIYHCLKANKVQSVAIHFDGVAPAIRNAAEVADAFCQGAELAAYTFDQYKSKKSEKEKEAANAEVKLTHIDLLMGSKTNLQNVKKGIERGQILSACVNFSRRLGDTPGNLLTPEILAEETVKAAKGSKLKVTVWDKARIKKEGFGGLLGVSLGSAVEPRFIIMEYNGGPKNKKPVCLIGKGLTFDCGGISIKPSAGMEEMKYDKCGGTNVIGAMLAISRLKLKVNVLGLVPATENMPGPLANKPGDILVARNGKTVEVDNTDAEGRLILMDAISYACEQKPAAIFDAATLTGACVVALGNSYTGCFTRSEKVRKKVSAASEISGEMVWQMPINDHHVSDMKGTYADLNNISSFKGAGASTAAAFLEQFVDKEIPWAHFDIAGTAWHVGNRLNYCNRKGASGVMIRTFVELVQMYN
jgi:leucyl aminopeptidase